MIKSRYERIFIGVALLGLIFKIAHIVGAGFILTISLSALAIIYFLSGRPAIEAGKQPPSFAWAAAIFFAVVPIGILFRLQRWPMSETYLAIGGIGCGLVFIISYLL